jgi:hypothetical protein
MKKKKGAEVRPGTSAMTETSTLGHNGSNGSDCQARSTMTPLQLAKAECANCDCNGNCQGVGIRDDLSLYFFRVPGRCYLADKPIQRCTYFEETIHPLPERMEKGDAKQNKRIADYQQAVFNYKRQLAISQNGFYRKCRDCGKQIPRSRIFCPECAGKRTRFSKRDHMRQKRSLDVEKQLL